MKRNAIKTAALAAAILAAIPVQAAWSLFGTEAGSLFRKAEQMRLAAETAAKEGRVLDEYDALVFAVRDFDRLAAEFPKHRTEEVLEKGESSRARLIELSEGIKNGTIAVPDPDDVAPGASESPQTAQPAQQAPAPATGADRYPIPQLVTTTSAKPPSSATNQEENKPEDNAAKDTAAAPDPELLAKLEAPIPNPFFTSSSETFPPPHAVPELQASPAPAAKLTESSVPATELQEIPEFSTAPSAPATADPEPSEQSPAHSAPRQLDATALQATPSGSGTAVTAEVHIRTIRSLIESGQASEAVIILEDALEELPNQESPQAVTMRTLLARAFLECRNPTRAGDELAALPESASADPAVRSLRAALATARGKYAEAILQLHLLVSENPNWADAYVDLAWAHFLLDPAANRAAAVSYYETALSRGAGRDPALERALRVKIEGAAAK